MPNRVIRTLASLSLVIAVCIAYTLPASAQHSPEAFHEQYMEGLKRYHDGQPEQAIILLEKFIEQNPGHPLHPSASFHITKAKSQLDPDNLEGYYEQFIAAWPVHEHTIDLLLDLAHARSAERRHDDAIAIYRRAAEQAVQDNRAPQIWYWMAEAAIAKGDNNMGRRYFQVIVDTYPRSDWAPKALFSQGSLYLRDEIFPMASSTFETLRAKYPRSQAARNIGTALGESYYMQGRYQEAIDNLKAQQSILEPETRMRAIYLIAESYNALDEYEEASNYYLQYINMNEGKDDQRRAHYGLGWLYHKQEIYHWAANSFEKAADGNDELARKALYYKAVNEKIGGRYREALETFTAFGAKYKTGLWIEEAYYEWALTAFDVGNNVMAIDVCLDLIRRNMATKQPGLVFILLGEAYYANNEFTRAIQAFDAAAETTNLDPDIKRQARFQKGWALFREMAFEEAQPIFEALVREQPTGTYAAEALFWNADAQFNLKRYQQSATLFQRFIDQHPNHELIGAARYSLGWSYFQMGEFERAIPPLQSFLRDYKPPPIAMFPYDVDTNLRIGDAYFATRNYALAIDAYGKVTSSQLGGDYAQYQIGMAYDRASQPFEAVNAFRKVVDNYPQSNLRHLSQFNIGYIYLLGNNHEQAVSEFETLIRLAPGTNWAARAQYNIGDAWYNAGDYQKAIEAYQVVLNRYPRSDYVVDAINSIRDAGLAIGLADNSNELMDQFLANNPNATTADRLRLSQARSLLDAGDVPAAINAYREIDRLTSDDLTRAEAQFNLADAYERQGNDNAARAAYLTIVNQYPSSNRMGPALANLGRLAYDSGNYNESLQYFERLSRESTRMRQEARIGMGNAYLALGDGAKARENFAAAGSTTSDAVKLGLAKADLSEGRYDQAEAAFRELAQNSSSMTGAEAQFQLGRAQQLSGRCQEAVTSFGAVRVLFGAYETFVARAMLEQSSCYDSLGNRVESRRILQQLADDYPNTDAGREAARLLGRSR